MNRDKVVTVGTKKYMVVRSQPEGKWQAMVIGLGTPTAQGLMPVPPQLAFEAGTEDELDLKLTQHFEKLCQKQNTDTLLAEQGEACGTNH